MAIKFRDRENTITFYHIWNQLRNIRHIRLNFEELLYRGLV
jgi:hypothetical protein